uniref:Uncharacterized protein n=1 Tax=Arundo donax TaxID=35708 RepID=A0A0A8YPH6_ARUDO
MWAIYLTFLGANLHLLIACMFLFANSVVVHEMSFFITV